VKIIKIVYIVFCMTLIANAATRNDVLVLEASESLKTTTQDIAHKFLLSMRYPYSYKYKDILKRDIDALSSDIQQIATNTNDEKAKGLLMYFATKKAEILQMLNSKKDKKSADEMVMISELFDEGAKSIDKLHAYKFSNEEKMQMLSNSMKTVLNEILKYNLAIKEGNDASTYRNKLKQSIATFDKDMQKISQYPYPEEIMYGALDKLKTSWSVMKNYIEAKKITLPALLSVVGEQMQQQLTALSIYHSKKQ